MSFTYSKVRLVNKKKGELEYLKKWYITYIINYPNDEYPIYPVQGTNEQQTLKNKRYPKIYGKEYGVKLNEIKDIEEKKAVGKALALKIETDLFDGVDPRLIQAKADKEAEEADEEAMGISFNEALDITRKYMQWDLNLPAKRISEKQNISFFKNDFARFLQYIQKFNDITKVTQSDLIDYINLHTIPGKAKISNGIEYNFGHWSLKTAFEKIRQISSIFNALIDVERLEINPCTGVTDFRKKLKKSAVPKNNTNSNRFEIWSEAEMKKFHKVGNSEKYITEYCIGLITYYTFIRGSEILRLKLSMIDYDNSRFVIPSDITKAHAKYEQVSYLYVKIPPILMEVLKKYIDITFDTEQKPEYYLFPDKADFATERDYSAYKANYNRNFSKELDIVKTEYALKHTGVTDFYYKQLSRGISIPLIIEKLRKMCRHANPQETMKYLNLKLGLSVEDDSDDDWG
jgi:integrase